MPSEAELLAAAHAARETAYAPYSQFAVGAALLADNGRVYRAGNVENASYGLGICAERAAICAAVADGARRFTHVAIAGPASVALSPCGACRQVLHEFSDDLVVLRERAGVIERFALADLLPDAFGPRDLEESR